MSKEILRPNTVDARTIFIGVGGIGSEIVIRVAEMCRPGETENVNFVCMDTNANDLKNAQTSRANIRYIQTSSTLTVGDYLRYDQDALDNWFPKNKVLYGKSVSEGAGQVRAISRLALNATIKNGTIAPLCEAIDDLFRKDGAALRQALRIVLVSSASGGTGSGMVLPLAMYVRDYVSGKYPNTGSIIRAMLVLPETLDSVIDSNTERESQRRNAYATVKEFNAFMMKGTGIFDTDEELSRFRDLHIDVPVAGSNDLRRLDNLPCDFCFLMDGQNAEDSTLISLDQYKKQAAQALYEQNIGPMQRKAFSVEDNVIKEFSVAGNYARNRFGGIGAATLRYPYEELAEYVACSWALEDIDSNGAAAKWSRYDRTYEMLLRESKNKGQAVSDQPTLQQVYIDEVTNGEDPFSHDLRTLYLQDWEDSVDSYFSALFDYAHATVNEVPSIRDSRAQVRKLAKPLDYMTDGANNPERGKASGRLLMLRTYEASVRTSAEKAAQSVSQAVFQNESKTSFDNTPYHLEALIKNLQQNVMHPNAIRFMLYAVKARFDTELNAAKNDIQRANKRLSVYSPSAAPNDVFDARHTRTEETSIDALCEQEHQEGEGPTLVEKLKHYEEIYDKLNQHFPAYTKGIDLLCTRTADQCVCQVGLQYVDKLLEHFERFYDGFASKVQKLKLRQEEILNGLQFTKGDSVLNICSEPALVAEISRTTKQPREDGVLLPSDLCGTLFDALKANVAFERETQYLDVVEEDRRIDLFDQVLLDYYHKNVLDNAKGLDMNVIRAAAMECRLRARLDAPADADAIGDSVTFEDCRRYVERLLAQTERLAAPGIQRLMEVEPREVKCSAYHISLTDMRDFRMGDLLPKGIAVDTVSKYEVRFFNAIYNLTPDRLNKFACEEVTESKTRVPGLYHKAYVTYSRSIGPDSTKELNISTHVDKRWDSLAVIPELDFRFQARQMMRIHQAMIYALVHRSIVYRSLSRSTELASKRVYRYETSSERLVDLVVSNGTCCDEFYEILDAFYLNSAIVSDVELIKEKQRNRDRDRNSNYSDTLFARNLAEFRIDHLHDGACSLFEIPLFYYNSLPNSMRHISEITALVDAVFQTFRDEMHLWESGNECQIRLCSVLVDQFKLFIANFLRCPALNGGHPEHPKENYVVDTTFRRLRNILSDEPEPVELNAILSELRALVD